MTWTQEDQREKIRSQLQFEITHTVPAKKRANKPSVAIQDGGQKKSARARFCERMALQARTDPGRI